MKDLTLTDFEGFVIEPGYTGLDLLALVAERGKSKEEEEEQQKKDETNKQSPEEGSSSLFDFSQIHSKGLSVNVSVKIVSKVTKPDNLSSEEIFGRERLLKKPMVHGAESSQETYQRNKNLRKKRTVKKRMVDEEGSQNNQDHEVAKKKRKTNAINNVCKKNLIGDGPIASPGLPKEFKLRLRQLIGNQEAIIDEEVLVIQKNLFYTDISKGHNRLSIPLNRILKKFLTDDEIIYLESYKVDKKKNVNELLVNLIDPSLANRKISLRRWFMKKDIYVITQSWNKIVSSNRLMVGDALQVWAIRVDGKLWLALVKLDE